MKNLSDYIKKSYNNYKNIIIENELQLHFYAEFIVGDCSYNEICERYGSYLGQKELILDLAKEIDLIISNNDPEDTFILDKNDLSEYSNIFFNKLEIQFSNNTAYIPNKSNFINKDNLFDKVFIYINPKIYNNYKSIAKALMHEILHAWDNYQSYIKNAKFNLHDLTKIGSKYSKTLYNDDKDISNICKRICNMVSQAEQNAYLNELTIELDLEKFDITKYHSAEEAYKDAYDIFINSDIWYQYSGLWNWFSEFKNNSSKNEKELFTKTYNEINNTKYNFNKIYNKLDGLFNKILKKMELVIPKIFRDYYDEQNNKILKEGLIRGDHSFIDYINTINEYKNKSSVVADNGLPYKVYLNNKLDKTFTDIAKHWKRKPKIGHGWYCGGAVFEIIKIEDNKVYIIEKE